MRLSFSAALLLSSTSFAADVFVDPTCDGSDSCFATIQAAIDAADAGDDVRIRPGTYAERLTIRGKNNITIGPAEDAPIDGVILDGKRLGGGGCNTPAIDLTDSGGVTFRRLVITGFRGPAIRLDGGPRENRSIRIERNRIFDNGGNNCNGGIVIEKGSPDTLVVNNLIYANGGNGIDVAKGPGRGRGVPESTRDRRATIRGRAEGLRLGGPHFLIQNTIHGNGGHGIALSQGQRVILANNAVTSNGRREGYGIFREGARDSRDSTISVRNNLICGNAQGEVSGPVLVGDHVDNLTPTGAEATGVLASPECLSERGVYADLEGADGRGGTIDDDFVLTGARADGLPSPAIDRGLDPRTLELAVIVDPLLLADFVAPDVRPVQGDSNRPLDFDIGAHELPCDCSENCETCRITINDDGSSVSACARTYSSATQCCNRITGEVEQKEIGQAYDVCPDTRTPIPSFDPQGSSDGCSAVPDHPMPLCPFVAFGCDEDAGEENCPEGIDLPCNNHDFCYQTCGETKEACDLAFRNDMLDICNRLTGAQTACIPSCLAAAAAYYDGVALAPPATEAYENGQNRSCQCCQDVFPPASQP